jgi:hypothetical protein
MTFLRMLIMKVDPFAVYAAERELAAAGRTVPRELLVSHYLLCGQLRTLVSKLLVAPPGGRVDDIIAAAIALGPDESANPRFVSPLCTGSVLSAVTLILAAVLGLIDVVHMGWASAFAAIDLRGAAMIAGFIVVMCMAYAFLGARIGRESARKAIGLLAGLALVGLIVWLTHYLDHH